MKPEDQIHRFFDGALSEEERSAMEQMMAEDPELAQTLESLHALQRLHENSMPSLKDHAFIESQLSEIWEGIPLGTPMQTSATSTFWSRFSASWLTKPLLAASTVAALMVAVTLAWKQSEDFSSQSTMVASVGFVHSDIPGASSMIFSDTLSDWTIVWVDEPEPPSLAG